MIYAVGHKNPDTDTICSAIAIAELLKQRNIDAEAKRQGELNPETKFVLEKFSIKIPEIIEDSENKNIFLVDHSDKSQSIDNIDKANIKGIVDHHKLGDITTSTPLEFWALPVGCTCTIIKGMYDFYNIEISEKIAGIMLCAILSDTVLFKSPTTTDLDEKVAKELAKIAKVDDIKKLAMDMFNKKSDVEGKTMRELIFRDYKDFVMNEKKVGVSQLEVVDITIFDSIKDDLFNELQKIKDEGRNTVLLLLTDIMKEGSELICISNNPELVEKAFNIKFKDNKIWLDGIMSRKKQVIPNLQKAFL
ncbi:MAG: manganese-dependent inorganic pyrophosphatase [Nanoarchaeota archaeon]